MRASSRRAGVAERRAKRRIAAAQHPDAHAVRPRAAIARRKKAPARPGRKHSSGQDLKLRVEGGCGSRPVAGETTRRNVHTATSLAGKRRNASSVRPGLERHAAFRGGHHTSSQGPSTCFEISFFSQSMRSQGQSAALRASFARRRHRRRTHAAYAAASMRLRFVMRGAMR